MAIQEESTARKVNQQIRVIKLKVSSKGRQKSGKQIVQP
jgi:hypothetical protein